ncbi:hypothetical protein cypCar_00041128, partial [Cyprinus carpio]
LSFSSLNDCGITDVACLAQHLAKTKALHFLKELDLKKNKIGNSKKQLSKALKDSNCNLNLDSEQRLFRSGWFYIVKSTGLDQTPSDEGPQK